MPTEANWYHAHAVPVSRAEGRSAVGLVAYVTGQSLTDELTGKYCRRNHPGDVMDWGSTAPAGAPAYLTDKDQIGKAWNAVERSETRVNSHVAQHWNIASSREFALADHVAVAKEAAQRLTDRYGVLVTWSVHEPTEHGNEHNWHIHLAHNMRRVGQKGFGEKVRELSARSTSRDELKWQRGMIADVINQRLEMIGSNERVSHLSYEERGIEREPTVHLGDKQNQAELQGNVTPIGDWNRGVRERNERAYRERGERDATIKGLEAEIVDLQAERERRKKLMSLDETEYKRTEDMKREAFAKGEDLAGEYAKGKERQKSEDFLRQFEIDRSEGERKRHDELNRRTGDPEIKDARGRYLESLGKSSGRTTFDVLISAARDEAATISREHDQLTRQAALEKDTDKKGIILLRRDIQHADYMAQVSGRLEGISRFNEGIIPNRRLELDENGKRVPTQAERRAEEKQHWTQQGTLLREELDKRRELHEVRQLDKISDHIERQQAEKERGINTQHHGGNRYRHLDEQQARAQATADTPGDDREARRAAAQAEYQQRQNTSQQRGERETTKSRDERPALRVAEQDDKAQRMADIQTRFESTKGQDHEASARAITGQARSRGGRSR